MNQQLIGVGEAIPFQPPAGFRGKSRNVAHLGNIDDKVLNYMTTNLTSGKEFDSGEITFTLGKGNVIPGWDLHVAKMHLGQDEKNIRIPWKNAYGEQGMGIIPPKSDLLFDMKLLKIQ